MWQTEGHIWPKINDKDCIAIPFKIYATIFRELMNYSFHAGYICAVISPWNSLAKGSPFNSTTSILSLYTKSEAVYFKFILYILFLANFID